MATLGLALRKDFPQYYPFFKTESFSYQGKTYTTHNHVMTRYGGVDGIKTGYIRASGFNLVTSVKRDNHMLIGVVLGGESWRARDDKMIALLDQNFTRLASGNTNTVRIQVASSVRSADVITSALADEEATEGQDTGQGDLTTEADVIAVNKKESLSLPIHAERNSATQFGWGIQVGAYARKSDAVNAATHAMKEASRALGSSKIYIGERTAQDHYRARLSNLSQVDAESACKLLSAKQLTCFVYKN